MSAGPKTPRAGAEGAASVCALVLTFERPEKLETCLDRLDDQTRPPDLVLVVDNASGDRTPELLARRGVETLRSEINSGAAGGFGLGLREAIRRGFDWVWTLDDDAWPGPGCLEALLDGAERAPAKPDLMTSAVRWTDGNLHPMNQPWPRSNERPGFADAAARGLVSVRAATFVSTMVSAAALDRAGLPLAHYGIWTDDIEWTARIIRDGHGFLVPESTCDHATAEPSGPEGGGRRYYYKVRNELWMLRSGDSFRGWERVSLLIAWAASIVRYLSATKPRLDALRTVARGVRDGLRSEPA